MRRQAIKRDPGVMRVIKDFWEIGDLQKDLAPGAARAPESGRLTREAYFRLSWKLHEALVPNVEAEEAQRSAERDWATDSEGVEYLDYERFARSMFQVCPPLSRCCPPRVVVACCLARVCVAAHVLLLPARVRVCWI